MFKKPKNHNEHNEKKVWAISLSYPSNDIEEIILKFRGKYDDKLNDIILFGLGLIFLYFGILQSIEILNGSYQLTLTTLNDWMTLLGTFGFILAIRRGSDRTPLSATYLAG